MEKREDGSLNGGLGESYSCAYVAAPVGRRYAQAPRRLVLEPVARIVASTASFRKAAHRLFLILGLTVGLAMTAGGVPRAVAQSAGDEDRPVVSLDELPLDLSLVIGASVLRMRGVDDPETTWPIIFSSPAGAGLQEPDFDYDGFTLVGVALTDWDLLAAAPPTLTLNALLIFGDPAGRRATMSLIADYGFTEENMVIGSASALTLAPPDPEVRLFIVPAEDVPDDVLDVEAGELELLHHVAAHAVGVSGSAQPPTTARDYYVFAFIVDRLPPDAQVQLRVSDTPEGIDGEAGNAVDVDFHGWRVAVLRGTFTLNSGPELFIKAVYTPGGDTPPEQRSPRLAAVFSSHLDSGTVKSSQ